MVESKTTPDLQEGDRDDYSDWKVVRGVGYSSARQAAVEKRALFQSSQNGRPNGGSDRFEFENMVLDCVGCHSIARFDFSPGEQKFFRNLGLLNRPKRCKACRVSRKGKSSNRPPSSTANSSSIPGLMSQNRFSWAQPPPAPPRPLRSLRPITTTLAVVVSVDQGACLACYGDGSSVELQCSRDLGVGTYVTLTRSTKGKRLHLHEVVGDSPPDVREGTQVLLRGTVLDVADGEVSILFQPGLGAPPSTLSCPAPTFPVSKGAVVLFSPSFLDGDLTAAAVIRVTSPVSMWSTRAPPPSDIRWAVAPPRSVEVLHPESVAFLPSVLGIDAVYRSPPSHGASSVKYSFFDAHQRGPVPRVSLLAMEEHMLLQAHSPDSEVGNSVSISDSLIEDLSHGVKGVLVATGTKSTGHLLAAYLRDSLGEIDDLGLSRNVKVLYPVDKGVTPSNIRGTVSSKLFSSRLLPISRIQILTRPLALSQVDQATGKPTGLVRMQHFAVITMEVSEACLPVLPPASWLDVPPTNLGLNPDAAAAGFKSVGCGVRLLVPITESRDTFSREAIEKAMPAGTILHSTSHSMKHSYTSYMATFPSFIMAEKFVSIVSNTNQSGGSSSSQWLVAPSSEFWEGKGIYTMFTTAISLTRTCSTSCSLPNGRMQ